MFVRQVKRKCGVRGCKNTDCFAISRTREIGNTVIICKSCLGKALGAIDEINPKTKSNIPVPKNTAAPALFFNAKALGVAENAEQTDREAEQTDTGHDEESQQIGEGQEHGEDESKQTGGNADDADTSTNDDGDEGVDSTDTHTAKSGVVSCPACGKEFDSKKGLKAHARYCKHPTVDEVEV